ncbi:MAG: endonuclease [Proteobacteria bacterium]|nr:endonuclease [Pseudomonadota bacterium]
MLKVLCIIALLYYQTIYAIAPNPLLTKQSVFSHLLMIYEHHPFTFFCEQRFNKVGNLISACQKCPNANSIQWMAIVPYQQIAKNLQCFNQKLCVNKQGLSFKGLRCCQKIDSHFRFASLDLHNFVPENILIKKQRRQYAFAEIVNHPHSKQCLFEVDKKNKIIMTLGDRLGAIARTYLYMRDTYRTSLDENEISRYLRWHQQFPPTTWEREKNRKIKAIQGNGNPYIPD